LVVAANPIFVLQDVDDCEIGGELVFEVFEQDAGWLKTLMGSPQTYALNSQAFTGTLTSLEPCVSTRPGLNLLRDRPTLRGKIVVLGGNLTRH
jgi:hypothetical protein